MITYQFGEFFSLIPAQIGKFSCAAVGQNDVYSRVEHAIHMGFHLPGVNGFSRPIKNARYRDANAV